MPDVLGHAINDFYFKLSPGRLLIHNKFGEPDIMSVATYFRSEGEFPLLEMEALNNCTGNVLDIGAGAGSHALYLQHNNVNVTALELSPLAANVIRHRGVIKVINDNVFRYHDGTFNTILMLMNGIGLTANIAGLHTFFDHIKPMLASNGQVLFDSSDVSYLYNRGLPATPRYYGEIDFRYEYKRRKTAWFTWLYIDAGTMQTIAGEHGFIMTVLFEDEHDQYLARLVKNGV